MDDPFPVRLTETYLLGPIYGLFRGDADGFAPGRSETSVVTLRAGSLAVNVPSEEAARLPDCFSASASDVVQTVKVAGNVPFATDTACVRSRSR